MESRRDDPDGMPIKDHGSFSHHVQDDIDSKYSVTTTLIYMCMGETALT